MKKVFELAKIYIIMNHIYAFPDSKSKPVPSTPSNSDKVCSVEYLALYRNIIKI